MTNQELLNIKERLNSVISSVRLQDSGADVHTIGNIRHTAQMLVECLNSGSNLTDESVIQIVDKVEKQVVDFYQKKYSCYTKVGADKVSTLVNDELPARRG